MTDFWDFLEAMRLPDHCLADGYEQAGPELRGRLKKSMAVHHELLEQRLPPRFQRAEISYGASLCSRAIAPAPWCLILHDAAYPAAPRALAAALPAQLAGVPVIWSIAVRGDDTPAATPPAVLAAWELAGIENVAGVDLKTFLPQLREFAASLIHSATHGSGRVLILGNPAWSREVRDIFRNERTALLRLEGPPPRILLTGDQAAAYHPVICALHPDADLRIIDSAQGLPDTDNVVYAAVFSSKNNDVTDPDAEKYPAALHLDYEHCGCWIWPELDAAFFLNHKLSLVSML